MENFSHNYRPHIETMTPMLEVTRGCSYNKCSFCTMYMGLDFEIVPEKEIREHLEKLRQTSKAPIRRILLLSGDPLCLPMEDLVRIQALIREYFPTLNTITCFASILNLRDKSLEDLKTLRSLGYKEFHIGLETGYEEAFDLLNKDYSLKDMEDGLAKLQEANIEYHAIIMAGIAGKGTYRENVRATVRILEMFPPITLSVYPCLIQEGSGLAKLREEGLYEEASQREKIQGQVLLLKEAKLPPSCFYSGNFVFNLLPATAFFKDKYKLVAEFERYLREADPEILEKP